jgi:hypothetical protein
MENVFKFKKGDLEIELSGEKEYVVEQIKDWKVFVEKFVFNSTETHSFNLNSTSNLNLSELSKDLYAPLEPIEELKEQHSEHNLVEQDKVREEKATINTPFSLNDIINSMEKKEIKIVKKISFDDFVKLKEPNTDEDKVMVGAYFLEKYEKQEAFTEMELYRLLNTENIEKYVFINIEKGLLTFFSKENAENKYTLTYSGEMYVKDGLQS